MFLLEEKEQFNCLLDRLVANEIEFDRVGDQVRIKDPNGMNLIFSS